MRYLFGDEKTKALEYIAEAAKVALHSTCERSHCGSIIVQGDEIIGRGFNSPPGNQEEQRRCSYSKDMYHPKVTDKTCCVHAEQRAIIDALRNNPGKITGSRLYFIRLDNDGNRSNTGVQSGKPYCTICSKMALDVGIAEFVLRHEEGIAVYDTQEYNLLSFQYGK